VAHLIKAIVQRTADPFGLLRSMIDARTRASWAQTYYRDLADVFAIPSDIAKAIATFAAKPLLTKESIAAAPPLIGRAFRPLQLWLSHCPHAGSA